jgi:periodic tryptophan protein 1
MIFAAGKKNGTIDIWDLRKDDRPIINFFAHEKSLNCLDWHPSDENVIITGSNDKTIRIWNLRDDRQGT